MSFFTSKAHRWAPDQRYVLSSESDWIIQRSARLAAAAHGTPPENRLSFYHLKIPVPDLLRALTLDSRLYLNGHGTANLFEEYDPESLARLMAGGGLKRVGVIKLNACNGGKGDYLEQLLMQCTRQGIQVGYLSAMKGRYHDFRKDVEDTENARPLLAPRKAVGSLPEFFGIRTIKGNVDIRFPGTRYNIRDRTVNLAQLRG